MADDAPATRADLKATEQRFEAKLEAGLEATEQRFKAKLEATKQELQGEMREMRRDLGSGIHMLLERRPV